MERARECLKRVFPDARFTAHILTPAYGEGQYAPLYANMLCRATTEMDEGQLNVRLKALERELGDTRALRQNGTVMMDIDLLEYKGEKRHEEDWEREYVKRLEPLFPPLSP